jgi:hypothetical protein
MVVNKSPKYQNGEKVQSKTKNTSLKELIINNPRAKQRIEIKEIEKEIKDQDRKLSNKNQLPYCFM